MKIKFQWRKQRSYWYWEVGASFAEWIRSRDESTNGTLVWINQFLRTQSPTGCILPSDSAQPRE